MAKVRSGTREEHASCTAKRTSTAPPFGGDTSNASTQTKMSQGKGTRLRIQVANFASIALFPKPDDAEHNSLRSFRLRSSDSALKISDCSESFRGPNKPMPLAPGKNGRLSEQLRKFRHFDSKFTRPRYSSKGFFSSNTSGAVGSKKNSPHVNYFKSATSDANVSNRRTPVHKLITSARCRPSLLRRFRVSSGRNSKFDQSCERVVSSDRSRNATQLLVQKENICSASKLLETDEARFVCVDGEKSQRGEDTTGTSTRSTIGLNLGSALPKKRIYSERSSMLKEQLFLRNIANKNKISPERIVSRLPGNESTKSTFVQNCPQTSKGLNNIFPSADNIQSFPVNYDEQGDANCTDLGSSLNPHANSNVSKRNRVRNSSKNMDSPHKQTESLSSFRCNTNKSLGLGCLKRDVDIIIIEDSDMPKTPQKGHCVNDRLCNSSNDSHSLNISNISQSSLRSFRRVQSAHERSIPVREEPAKEGDKTETNAASLRDNVALTAIQVRKKDASSNSNTDSSRSRHVNASSSWRRQIIHDLENTRTWELRKYRNAPDIVSLSSDEESTFKSINESLESAIISKSSCTSEIEGKKTPTATNRNPSNDFISPKGCISLQTNDKRVLQSAAPIESTSTFDLECLTGTSGRSAQQSYVIPPIATRCPASRRADRNHNPGTGGLGLRSTLSAHMSPTAVPDRALRTADDRVTTTVVSGQFSPRIRSNQGSPTAVPGPPKLKNKCNTFPTAVVHRSSHSLRGRLPLTNMTCQSSPRVSNEHTSCTAVTCRKEKRVQQSVKKCRGLRQIKIKRLFSSGSSHNTDSQCRLSNSVFNSNKNSASSNSSPTKRNSVFKKQTCRQTLISASEPSSHYPSESSPMNDDFVPIAQSAQASSVNLSNGIEFIDCSKLKHEPVSSQKSDRSSYRVKGGCSTGISDKLGNHSKCNVSSTTHLSSFENCSTEQKFVSDVSHISSHLRIEQGSFGRHSGKNPTINLKSTGVNSVINSFSMIQSSKVNNGSREKLHGRASSRSLRLFRLRGPDASDTNENRVASLGCGKKSRISFQADEPDIVVDSVVTTKSKTFIQYTVQ